MAPHRAGGGNTGRYSPNHHNTNNRWHNRGSGRRDGHKNQSRNQSWNQSRDSDNSNRNRKKKSTHPNTGWQESRKRRGERGHKNKNRHNKIIRSADSSQDGPPKRPILSTPWVTGRDSRGYISSDPKSPNYKPHSDQGFSSNARENRWWSVPYQKFTHEILGSYGNFFDRSRDPRQNPFSSHPDAHRLPQRTPLEIEFENILGWRDIVHDYSARDDPAQEAACSTCIALAHQLLITKTGLPGAPGLSYDEAMKTPRTPYAMIDDTINTFMDQVVEALRTRDGKELRDILQVEPPFKGAYGALVRRLRDLFPPSQDDALETFCEDKMQPFLDGLDKSWGAFTMFLRDYFRFIRDVDQSNDVITHSKLMALLKQCTITLNESTLGVLVLPTVLHYSKLFTRLTIELDKRPELIAYLRRQSIASGTEDGEKGTSLVEESANVIREAFGRCLNDTTGGPGGRTSKAEGKRVGIYALANKSLKLFFRCKKIDNAQQLFNNISGRSPPLSLYPVAERVTYLYYLGRYMFANSHFYRAQLVLEAAYIQCHRQAYRHRRLILMYLIASNIIIGRHPSALLYSKPEAKSFAQIFAPICEAIVKGDIYSFRLLTSLDGDSPIAEWLLQNRMLLQIRNRCELLVWRSLAKKVFLLDGFHGDPSNPNRTPYLHLKSLLAAGTYLEENKYRRTLLSEDNKRGRNGSALIEPTSVSTASIENTSISLYTAPEFDGLEPYEPYGPAPDMMELESIFSSLIDQRLLVGYLTRGENPRFAIPRAQGTLKGALKAGWPSIWRTLKAKAEEEGDAVPGWVKAPNEGAGLPSLGSGGVIHLSGARPVGQ